MPGVNLDLGNPFFQTYIKKRLEMMYRKKSTWKSYLKFALPVLEIVFMAFVIQEDDLILNYQLDSQYIDLFAGDDLLKPGDDYVLDHETKKVIISNKKYIKAEGVKYCMFIIDEPRPLTDFQNIQKPETTDFVAVRLSIDGVSKV